MKIRIKKLHPDAVVPEYKSNLAAGFDLVALEDTTLKPGETKLVSTGVAIDVGHGYQLEVRNRSGMALKTPLRVANSPGTVDADYRGEVFVMMTNTQTPGLTKDGRVFDPATNPGLTAALSYTIRKGDRIAQGVVMTAFKADIEVVDYLDETDRGSGGFGSTGK